MLTLIVAAAAFLAIHLFISGTRLRDVITRAIGEGPFQGLFSVASIVLIVWMVKAYVGARDGGENMILYDIARGRDFGLVAVALAFLLVVPGLLTRNPTTVGQQAAALRPETVRGVLRITRHPFLWGVAIWALFHTAANGDQASMIFFGTFFVLAVAGTFSIDAKRRRKMGDRWTAFAEKTSNVPFAAIVAGRTAFSAREYFDWRFAVALAAFAGALFAHASLFGASPF